MMTVPYWIGDFSAGRLAIVPRPRGGDWLEDELHAWRAAGLDVVVSLLEPEEITELQLLQEAEMCRAAGLEYFHFPIPDRGVPESASALSQFLLKVRLRLMAGKKVAIHCRQGVGRSALVAACLMVVDKVDPAAAFAVIAGARGCSVPDTVEQREWVAAYARGVAKWSNLYTDAGKVDKPPPEQVG